MINRLSERVVSWLRREGCVEASEVPLFRYAAYSFIWGLLPFIIVTVWGIIFNALLESTLLILPFMLIRKFSGGYHLSNPGICFATSTILLGFAVWGLTVINMYSFNTGDEALLSGRFFTGEEYTNGDDVCVISAAYAEQNGLRLGDMIQLDYYDSGFGEYNNGATANSMLAAEDPGPYRQRYYMSLDDAIGVCKNYTVIGIYTGARFAFGAYQLNADTILVPKASVPNAQNYETRANSLLNTFVLKNGSAKEFEKYMEQQNLAGQFLYFDQDFSSMQESLDALETNAMRLMMVGIGVFLLTSALFLFLNFRRMNLTIRGVRLLGRSSKAVFREIIMALIPLETLAVLFGTCAAIALFDVVTRNLLSSALTLRPEAMAVSAVTAFVFLMVSTMISTAIFANRKLMKAK